MTRLTIQVPAAVAKEAQDAGLLSPETLEAILRDELRRRAAVDELFQAAGQLAGANSPPMTMEEIQAEVNAVRTRRH